MNIPGYGPQAPPAPQMQADGDPGGMDDQQMQGDGLQHHEIHEMPDGSAHSTHTDAEGKVDEMDHDSYEEACAACAGEDEPDGDEGADDGNASFADDGQDSGTPNIAASYGNKAQR